MTELSMKGMTLAPGVVETIISIATQEVEGVAFVGSAAESAIRQMFTAKPSTQGIGVDMEEDESMQVVVHIDVLYGYSLPQVADNVRRSIADALATQVGVRVDSVDVYVDGIKFAR